MIDRGFFLLTIGHLFIVTGHVALSDGVLGLLRWGFITDSIGISVIIGSMIVNRIRGQSTLLLSGILFSTAWSVILFWEPTGNLCVLLKETFFGSVRVEFYRYNFPIFPWLSLYLYGTYLGRKIGMCYVKQDWQAIERTLAKNCVVLLSLYASLKVGQILLIEKTSEAFLFGGTLVKYPPSGGFVFFYGAVGLLIALMVFKVRKTSYGETLLKHAAVFGKTSLFVFVIQYYIYNTILYLLKLPYSILWFPLFLGTIFLIYFCAKAWLDHGLNRLITLNWILGLRVRKSYV